MKSYERFHRSYSVKPRAAGIIWVSKSSEEADCLLFDLEAQHGYGDCNIMWRSKTGLT